MKGLEKKKRWIPSISLRFVVECDPLSITRADISVIEGGKSQEKKALDSLYFPSFFCGLEFDILYL